MNNHPPVACSPPNAPSIHLDDISVRFANTPLFNNLTVSFPAGQTTCVLGPSGCGKSTLLKLVAGHPRLAFSGRIRLEPRATSRNLVAWMGQNDLLLPWLTLLDNVLLGARLRGELSDEKREHARGLLREAGLAEHAGRYPTTLSGGMRQRGALLRTLMEERPILLMDEPFSALDALSRTRLQNLAARLTAGATVILVTHDPLEALRLGHRIVVLGDVPTRVPDIFEPDKSPPRAPDDPVVTTHHAALLKRLMREHDA